MVGGRAADQPGFGPGDRQDMRSQSRGPRTELRAPVALLPPRYLPFSREDQRCLPPASTSSEAAGTWAGERRQLRQGGDGPLCRRMLLESP